MGKSRSIGTRDTKSSKIFSFFAKFSGPAVPAEICQQSSNKEYAVHALHKNCSYSPEFPPPPPKKKNNQAVLFSQVPPTFICCSKGTCWRNLRLAVRSDLDCLPAAKGPEWPEIVRKGHQPWRRHLVCGETRSTTRVGKERVGMKNYPGFFWGDWNKPISLDPD